MGRIDVRKATKLFGNLKALQDVSFSVKKGVNVVLGPNGAGKSTLLKCVDGLYKLTSGSVRVNGTDPYEDVELHNQMSLMSDNYALYDDLSVIDNLKFFGRLYGLSDAEIETRSKKILKGMNAHQYLRSKVYSLSRGTKQKIAFCRTVINDPDILLLDEPTAFLDANAAEYIRDLIVDVSKGRIAVIVTQRIDEVTRFDARMLVLSKGKLIKDATTTSIYNEVLRNSFINIRLARPMGASTSRRLGSLIEVDSRNPALIRARVKNYKDIAKVTKELIDNGAYIVSIDYTEPMLEQLYAGSEW